MIATTQLESIVGPIARNTNISILATAAKTTSLAKFLSAERPFIALVTSYEGAEIIQ
ncbi:MAG: hypothetical protein ABJN95_20145 [Maribacter sp.]|uniref:hypothetical protein n=1 Tax=Maribacter sp. TaxID=1897614 RepID=UPI0032976FEE